MCWFLLRTALNSCTDSLISTCEHGLGGGGHKHQCYRVHAIKSVSSVNTCVFGCLLQYSIFVCAWLSVSSAHWGTGVQKGRTADEEAVASSLTHQTQAVGTLSASSQPFCQSHISAEVSQTTQYIRLSLYPCRNTRSNWPLVEACLSCCRILLTSCYCLFFFSFFFALYLSSLPI